MSQQYYVSIVYISKGLPLKFTPIYWFTQLFFFFYGKGSKWKKRVGIAYRLVLNC